MRIYAVREDSKQKILVAIRCDRCDEEVKPHPNIAESGWVKTGVYYGPGHIDNSESDNCPACYREI